MYVIVKLNPSRVNSSVKYPWILASSGGSNERGDLKCKKSESVSKVGILFLPFLAASSPWGKSQESSVRPEELRGPSRVQKYEVGEKTGRNYSCKERRGEQDLVFASIQLE